MGGTAGFAGRDLDPDELAVGVVFGDEDMRARLIRHHHVAEGRLADDRAGDDHVAPAVDGHGMAVVITSAARGTDPAEPAVLVVGDHEGVVISAPPDGVSVELGRCALEMSGHV